MDVNELYQLLLDVPVEDFIPLIVGLIILSKYFSTRILDYLIFANIFIFSYFAELFTYLSRDVNNLLYFQLTFVAVQLTYLFLLVHIHRIRKPDMNRARIGIEMIWGLAILIIIFNWELMMQQETSTFFGFTLNRGSSIYFPRGAGIFLFDGQVLISTAHSDLIYLFWVYVNGWAVYTYATMDLQIDTETTQLVRKLWVIAFTFAFLWTLSILSIFYTSEITNLLILITFILEIYIVLRYPEAMLLSQLQVERGTQQLDQKYQKLGGKSNEMQLEDQLNSMQDPTVIEQVYMQLSYAEAVNQFKGKKDTPHSLFILGKSRFIHNVTLSDAFQNYREELVGNLISALLSFTDEILDPTNKSKIYRFQSDEYSLVSIRAGNLLIVYVFSGFSPLAEIHLKSFIKDEINSENEAIWLSLDKHNISVMSSEQKRWIDTKVRSYFLDNQMPQLTE